MTGSSGQTAVISATEKENLGNVNILAKAGIEVNAKDIVTVLVTNGAYVNAKGKKYIQQNFRMLTLLLQVPPVKRHSSLQRREECGTSLTFSSSMMLM